MKPVMTRAHVILLMPKVFNITSLIFCAAPDSATSLPIMAPNNSIISKEPSVSPIPF